MAASFKTKTDAARDAIREAILEGDLRPGERLTVIGLAQRLGISATPVREAVRGLQAAGLLTQTPHRALEVVDLAVADSPEFYLVRATVESLATRLSVPHMTADRLTRLHRLQAEMRAAWENADVETFTRHNIAWHFAVYETCQLPHLVDYILRLWLGVRWGPRLDRTDHRATSMADHEEIMAAIDAGDAEAAAVGMHRHIMGGLSFVLDAGQGCGD